MDQALGVEHKRLSGRDLLVAIHGNRLVANMVFAKIGPAVLKDPNIDFPGATAAVPQMTADAFEAVRSVVSTDYDKNYPASLFKNATRCREILQKASAMSVDA